MASTKRWWFQCKDANGKTHKESLGDPRRIKCEAAREIARRRAAAIELGEDLTAKRDKAKVAAKAQKLKFGAVVEERYLPAKKAKLRKSSYTGAEYYLGKLSRDLHPEPIEAITLADVARVLDNIERVNGAASARVARSNLSALFKWCMKRGLVSANPVTHTEDPRAGRRDRRRRTLIRRRTQNDLGRLRGHRLRLDHSAIDPDSG